MVHVTSNNITITPTAVLSEHRQHNISIQKKPGKRICTEIVQSSNKTKLINYQIDDDKYENKYANLKEENKMDTISDVIQRHSQMNLRLEAQISKSGSIAKLNDGNTVYTKIKSHSN